MAELILSCNTAHKGPGAESYYDFDPANGALLEAIEACFAERSGKRMPPHQEEYLAELCARSVEDAAALTRRATLFGWMEILHNLFRDARISNEHRKRGNRRSRKPGNGFSPAGDRRQLSFA